MSSMIFLGDQEIFVSNRRFSTLVEFGLEVADSVASSERDLTFVQKLKAEAQSFYRGIDLDLEKLFLAKDEFRFWSMVYAELAVRIERKEIGNPEGEDWRPSATAEALALSKMLASAA
ncbi:hypothetical protein J2W27_002653 [Variovorax boronicumulans]|uniref:hypothetical protein n=1 Tax=Variovorax boronicumulans TaxID=436515 RepID=UPI0027889DCD|nr:hypothetical protein [Variovorax boronicumulans]MDP9910541.1 hypothetical protein [Variovorax boronicumulans]